MAGLKEVQATANEDLDQLRKRLADAEEILQAIHLGEVDGVVVEGASGPQVFTLQTPDQPYRALVECMSQGAASISEKGAILFCNRSLAEMVGRPLKKLLGASADVLVRPSDKQRFQELLSRAFETECEAEIQLEHLDGRAVPVKVSLREIAGAQVRSLAFVATDVSDIRRAEETIREQAALVDLAHDAMIFRKFDGRIVFWNRGAKDLYGWPAEEAIGKTTQELLQTKLPIPADTLYAAIRNAQEWEGELAQVRRDGSQLTVASRWSLLRDKAGEPLAILEVNRDITARKQAEQAIRQNEERLQLQIERMPLACILWDRDFRVSSWNPAAERIFGFKKEEALGRHPYEFIVPKSAQPAIDRVFERLLRGDNAAHSTNENVTADGRRILCRWTNTPLRNPEGQTVGVLSMAEDTTELNRAEEQLRSAARYVRGLIEASPDPLATISRDGKITDVNAATEKATGISRERLIGSDFSSYFTRPDEAQRGYERVFLEGTVRDYPLALRHASGQVTDVLYNASVFKNDEGGVEGVFAAARDVSQLKKAEAELRSLNEQLEERVAARTRELNAANKELESFNYAVAHDLRAPLRHIHGFAELLAQEAGAHLNDTGQRYLRFIQESIDRMSSLLQELLNLSRIGRQELRTEPCSLNVLVQQLLPDFEPDAVHRQIEWRIGELPKVECDPILMKQVLSNLLSNAVKFTRQRRPAVIEVGQTERRGVPVIFVRDNGEGFDMKYADKLFGVFQRLHRQEDFEGTGVGLAIVQRIIHRHGGSVWAEGELKRGATFYFSLQPCEIEDRQEAKEPALIA